MDIDDLITILLVSQDSTSLALSPAATRAFDSEVSIGGFDELDYPLAVRDLNEAVTPAFECIVRTCAVIGPRKSRRLHGYLLDDPAALFDVAPVNNPYLSLIE